MSALSHKQTLCDASAMSSLSPNADIPCGETHVVPPASIGRRAIEVEVANHVVAVAPVELLISLK